MRKRIMILLVICVFLVSFSACVTKEEYYLCTDNVTRVTDFARCPKNTDKPSCQENCDDGNNCTSDRCSAATDYKCVHERLLPCSGNGVCEEGEFPWSRDCPASCDDKDECTGDNYNYLMAKCVHEDIIPCCGNDECDRGETYFNCPLDCEQMLEIKVMRYEKRERFDAAYTNNLEGTQHIFLIVRFIIKNKEIDSVEILNYNEQKGFYYDPFKMRLEDDSGKFYDIEYDSDLIDGWLDYIIIPKGESKNAALMFIVPRSAKHLRLIVYDKYGSKLDSAEVY